MKAILQPFIPHYREKFFNGLIALTDIDIYCYETDKINTDNFNQGDVKITSIKSFQLGPFLFYNPFTLLKNDYDTLILMLTFLHITTWLLLITKPLHRKKIILWGHGISINRYIKEEKKPGTLLKWMIMLTDGVWFYTSKELAIWKEKFPGLKAVSLENTISDVETILNKTNLDKDLLKSKFTITQPLVVIFCARFNIQARRPDLLLETISRLEPSEYGFIIIGDGPLKPDFSGFDNVYDFGALYNNDVKSELFQIADIYFQPGWVGLSIVEAMAYGKPIFTFKRSEDILQCVEYQYIISGFNGLIFDSMTDFISTIENLDRDEIADTGKNARQYVKDHLLIENMVANAYRLINEVEN